MTDAAPHSQLIERLRTAAISDVALEAAMAHDSHAVRCAAAERAARTFTPARLLHLLLQHESHAARESAALALIGRGSAAVRLLAPIARGDDAHAAMLCVQVLSRIEEGAVLPLLRELAGHDDPLRSQAALEGLARRRDRASLPRFLDALTKDSWRAFTALEGMRAVADASVLGVLRSMRANSEVAEPLGELIQELEATRGDA